MLVQDNLYLITHWLCNQEILIELISELLIQIQPIIKNCLTTMYITLTAGYFYEPYMQQAGHLSIPLVQLVVMF